MGEYYCLKPAYRHAVTFRQQDVRRTMPDGCFHLPLCRNLVCTYCDDALQQQLLERLLQRLHPDGWLVVGVRESLRAPAAR
jgi:chemotaxis protein methyltransferase CheR